MRNYRIKNKCGEGYIVQERMLLFFWCTIQETSIDGFSFVDKVFGTIKEARDYIFELKESKKESKRKCREAKYIEYIK